MTCYSTLSCEDQSQNRSPDSLNFSSPSASFLDRAFVSSPSSDSESSLMNDQASLTILDFDARLIGPDSLDLGHPDSGPLNLDSGAISQRSVLDQNAVCMEPPDCSELMHEQASLTISGFDARLVGPDSLDLGHPDPGPQNLDSGATSQRSVLDQNAACMDISGTTFVLRPGESSPDSVTSMQSDSVFEPLPSSSTYESDGRPVSVQAISTV